MSTMARKTGHITSLELRDLVLRYRELAGTALTLDTRQRFIARAELYEARLRQRGWIINADNQLQITTP